MVPDRATTRRASAAARTCRYRSAACAALLALVSGAVGAAAQQDPSREYFHFYESAASYFAEGDYDAAIIELKNALQINPAHVPSRVLLGRAYLRSGAASAAAKELTQALYYGADEELALVPLGNALLLQRKHEEILERIKPRDPASSGGAGVLSIRDQAHLELGQMDEAELAFREAIWMAPTQAEPRLGLASVLAVRGDLSGAQRLLDEAGRLDPHSPEVWFRKGQLRLLAGDPQQALELFDRTLASAPDHMRARLARARLHIQREDFEAARTDADHILSVVPEDAHAALLSAQANASLGRATQAGEAFARAAQRIAEIDGDFLWRNPAALVLAGKISFVQRDFEKVNRYLTRYLGLRPEGSPVVRRLLGRARLETGNPKGAVDVLEPLVRNEPKDAEALALLGEAYLRARMYHHATDVLERASALATDDPEVRRRLALGRMGIGRTSEAILALKQSFALDATGMGSGLLLAFIQIRHGEIDAARRTAAELAARFSDNPVTENLVGVVERSAGDLDAARAAFVRALELDAGFEPAAFNLAGLELAEGRPDVAAAHYWRILERNSRSARAFTGLSEIAQSRGELDEAIRLLEKAVALAPDAVEPYLRLSLHQLSLKKPEEALRTMRAIADRHPENARVQQALARTQLSTGQQRDAIQTLRNASRLAGYAGEMLLDIGEMQQAAGDHEGAAWSYQKAIETDSRNAARASLVRLQLATGEVEKTLEVVRALREQEPDNPLGLILHAEIMAHQGRFDVAVADYEAALALAESTDATIGMFEVLMTAGRQTDALERLERWVARHPDDVRAKRALGLGYIASGRLDRAEALHDELLRLLPDDPLVLNNLARMYQLRKDPRARRFAQRALELAPGWPVVLDTLGWILVTEGEPEEGLRLLRDAHARASRNPLIRYHVAAALSELGRNREALQELDFILAAQSDVSWIDEVRALREKVAGR